jgi:Domain of unknown function (DUF4442)
MSAAERAEKARRRVLNPWSFRAYLLARLPLAAFAGLRVRRLDGASCIVSLPGGWRTRNPFGSTYFAAQAMAAEMSTGAPALMLTEGAPASVSLLVREVRGSFQKRIQGPSLFTFDDVAGMRRVVERAAEGGEGELYTARSVGRTEDGTVASEFEVVWTFRRRQ